MDRIGILAFVLYFVLFSVLAMQLLVGAWPEQPQPTRLLWGLLSLHLSAGAEVPLSLVAILAGALVFYFVIRAGFTVPGSQSDALKPYGVAAVATLAAMFSKETSDKLKHLLKELLEPPEKEERLCKNKLRADGEA